MCPRRAIRAPPPPRGWLAVLAGGRKAVLAVVEVVSAQEEEGETDAFVLFPLEDEGRPAKAGIGRCLLFVKPEKD